jgi:murein DD-endopeptidase MepM/ murein hydrolase activator NlpD
MTSGRDKFMRKKSFAFISLFILVTLAAAEAADPVDATAQYFNWPMGSLDPNGELVPGHGLYVMQNYANPNPHYEDKWHAGVDLSWKNDLEAYLAADMPVYAAADGRVKCVEDKILSWPGSVVVLEHEYPSETVYSVYGHLNPLSVVEGQFIASGEVIGTILDQGDNSHLHYEVRNFPYWSDKKDFGGTDLPEYERAPTPDNDVICAGRGYKPKGKDALPTLKAYGWRDPVRFYYGRRPAYPRPVVTTPQKTLNVYRRASPNSEIVGTVPRESTLTAYRSLWRPSDPNTYCDNLLARDRWYFVDDGSLRGFVPGFVCKGWRSELNVTESPRLGPDWQAPSGRLLIEYLFDDPGAFAGGVVTNTGSLGPRFDGTPIDASLSGSGDDYALDLDGDGAYVEVNNGERLPRTELVVEARVRRIDNVDEDAIVSKWYAEDQWLLTLYPGGNGSVVFSVRLEDGSYQELVYPIPDTDYLGQWVHVAGRYEEGRVRLYWQGRLVAERFFTGRMARGLGAVHVGDAGAGTSWSRFRGLIDEVRIWRPAK